MIREASGLTAGLNVSYLLFQNPLPVVMHKRFVSVPIPVGIE